MALPNIFTPEVAERIIQRIGQLEPTTQPYWGKMDAAQMMAHCNVAYELVYDNKHPRPGAFIRWILKTLVKKTVTSEVPYKRNSKTAPQFLIKEPKDFQAEKERLINHIRKTQQLGEKHFHLRESHSFGPLPVAEWNNLFYKHLDHHLKQFGV